VSSHISQSYPYSSESEADRAAAVAAAFAANDGLEDRVTAETTPLGEVTAADHGAPEAWWTWVCHACIEGRLHVAGYARDRHALYTVCDHCGSAVTR
jgi:hypothetical protein